LRTVTAKPKAGYSGKAAGEVIMRSPRLVKAKVKFSLGVLV
jgi:hypothetical protein